MVTEMKSKGINIMTWRRVSRGWVHTSFFFHSHEALSA
uniref:Uncharacterized protein n=1 Tax=Setaria italica TaxID=4555 RepID=K3Z1N6_SETIT